MGGSSNVQQDTPRMAYGVDYWQPPYLHLYNSPQKKLNQQRLAHVGLLDCGVLCTDVEDGVYGRWQGLLESEDSWCPTFSLLALVSRHMNQRHGSQRKTLKALSCHNYWIYYTHACAHPLCGRTILTWTLTGSSFLGSVLNVSKQNQNKPQRGPTLHWRSRWHSRKVPGPNT